MKPAKMELLRRHDTKCMICGRNVGKKIQWHHIVPRYAGGLDTYENGSLLCPDCHVEIHFYEYGDEEYTRLTSVILQNKRSHN